MIGFCVLNEKQGLAPLLFFSERERSTRKMKAPWQVHSFKGPFFGTLVICPNGLTTHAWRDDLKRRSSSLSDGQFF